MSMTDGQRVWVARRLFAESNRLTNPELIGALWNNLCAKDRQFWLDRANAQSAGEED